MKRWLAQKVSKLLFWVSVIWFSLGVLSLGIKALALAHLGSWVLHFIAILRDYIPKIVAQKTMYIIVELMYNNVACLIDTLLLIGLGFLTFWASRRVNPDRRRCKSIPAHPAPASA